MSRILHVFSAGLTLLPGVLGAAYADVTVITDRMHHLRQMEPREWAEFPEQAESTRLELKFEARATGSEQCLSLRQQDVKEFWTITLNGEQIGKLHRDENDMRVYYEVGFDLIKKGENVLAIECPKGRRSDDIRVGQIELHPHSKTETIAESSVTVTVRASGGAFNNPGDHVGHVVREHINAVVDGREKRNPELLVERVIAALEEVKTRPVPCRITILNEDGSLQECIAESESPIAVRPGTVYASTSPVNLQLPAGKYVVIAGRGLEYSIAEARLVAHAGPSGSLDLEIERQVPTHGWVACDTHVHTLTHSGHGDSTVLERMVTLAGEGIELPIATDHNVFIDHKPFAKEAGLADYFTPVIGNEVTTKTGHFNVFPVSPGAKLPDHKLIDWNEIADSINQIDGVKAIILNHARDIHSNVRPFGPGLFNDAVGENIKGWRLRANAMEVVNSGANQTDIMQLIRDWMTLLNRGLTVTPVGCSDSHDVARHFVGQGRTYIRCNDKDPGNIDINEAASSFVQGRVMVSYGLLTELVVNGRYGPGELARIGGDTVNVKVRVLGPHWTRADTVQLFANGVQIREEPIRPNPAIDLPDGIKWRAEWEIPRPKHDVHLVAIATGPGIESLHWKTAKPYQPDSPEWTPTSIGCSGAVWLDVDGDGRRSSARDYAEYAYGSSQGDAAAMFEKLADYDEATAAQAAFVYHREKASPNRNPFLDSKIAGQLKQATPHVQAGTQKYVDAWRRNQIAASQ